MFEDLESSAEYIARDSARYAGAFVREVRAAAMSLRKMALRGPVVPELNDPAIRELLVRNHRLIYKVEPKRVVLLALIHGARDFPSVWKRRGR
jgi:plasmid stabilization system protein ParE